LEDTCAGLRRRGNQCSTGGRGCPFDSARQAKGSGEQKGSPWPGNLARRRPRCTFERSSRGTRLSKGQAKPGVTADSITRTRSSPSFGGAAIAAQSREEWRRARCGKQEVCHQPSGNRSLGWSAQAQDRSHLAPRRSICVVEQTELALLQLTSALLLMGWLQVGPPSAPIGPARLTATKQFAKF
jgi:hypothetical protein